MSEPQVYFFTILFKLNSLGEGSFCKLQHIEKLEIRLGSFKFYEVAYDVSELMTYIEQVRTRA